MDKKDIVVIILISVIVLVLASMTVPVFIKMQPGRRAKHRAAPDRATRPATSATSRAGRE